MKGKTIKGIGLIVEIANTKHKETTTMGQKKKITHVLKGGFCFCDLVHRFETMKKITNRKESRRGEKITKDEPGEDLE